MKNYEKLRDLLAAGKWKQADEETTNCMLKVGNKVANIEDIENYLDPEHIDNFPCEDLRTIDQLWVKHSNGKFGFSVQKQIYQSLGGTREYDKKIWTAFCDQVGWRQGGQWVESSDKLTFSLETNYIGHLPSDLDGWNCDEGVITLLSRRDL